MTEEKTQTEPGLGQDKLKGMTAKNTVIFLLSIFQFFIVSLSIL